MAEIAIITPVYNAEAYIGQTIESVLSQSFENWVHILVDDGSSDSSFETIARYARQDGRIRPFQMQNSGSSGARNFGISMIESPPSYIMFLDHDDFLEPDTLAVLRQALLEHPDCSGAYGLARPVDIDGCPQISRIQDAYRYQRYQIKAKRRVAVADDALSDFKTFLDWDNIETPGQVLIRFGHFAVVGGFDSLVEPNEDWDIWLKLTRRAPFKRVNRFVINYRKHEGGISNHTFKMRRSEYLIRHKLAFSAKFSVGEGQAIRAGHFYSIIDRFSWALYSLKSGKILRAGKQYLMALRQFWLFLKAWYFNFFF